jgi:hypothetical protein
VSPKQQVEDAHSGKTAADDGSRKGPSSGLSQVDTGPGIAQRIAGLSALKGLILYGAVFSFAGFYAYFMERIATAATGKPPHLSTAMVGAAAALAGVLGSAFALVIGVPTEATNEDLGAAMADRDRSGRTRLRRVFSLEPARRNLASWPLTFGIWIYAAVATATAIVYLINSSETPAGVRALAIGFAGYVLAFMTAAYGIATKKGD